MSLGLRILRFTMLVLAMVGAVASFYFGRQAHQLRLTRSQLAEQVGALQVTDPDRVHVTAIPPTTDIVPPGIQQAHVWRFRCYLPADYATYFMTRRRAIAADSPRSRGGGGASWGQKSTEPREMEVNVSLVKTDGDWLLCRKMEGSSGAGSIGDDLPLDTLDDLIVEPVVEPGAGTKTFSVDEAICLLRVRGKEPLEPHRGEPPLYPGFVVYLAEADLRDAMDQWASGQIDGLPERAPE